jgi:hypothetical protein
MLGTDSNSYDVFQSTVHGLPFAACVKDVIQLFAVMLYVPVFSDYR